MPTSSIAAAERDVVHIPRNDFKSRLDNQQDRAAYRIVQLPDHVGDFDPEHPNRVRLSVTNLAIREVNGWVYPCFNNGMTYAPTRVAFVAHLLRWADQGGLFLVPGSNPLISGQNLNALAEQCHHRISFAESSKPVSTPPRGVAR
jgi:hypothetical protein